MRQTTYSGFTWRVISFKRPTVTFGTSIWTGVSLDRWTKISPTGFCAKRLIMHQSSTTGLSSVTLYYAISTCSSYSALVTLIPSSIRSTLCLRCRHSQRDLEEHSGLCFALRMSRTTTWKRTAQFQLFHPLLTANKARLSSVAEV